MNKILPIAILSAALFAQCSDVMLPTPALDRSTDSGSSGSTASNFLDQTNMLLATSDTETLTTSAGQSLSWESTDTSVVTVADNGNGTATITAVAAGNAVIVVSGAGVGRNSCKVKVVTGPIVAVTGVSLNDNSLTLSPGNTSALTETVLPSTASDPSVRWESSNESVAVVDSNGLVAATGPGFAVITVTTVDGNETATCVVTVNNSGGTPGVRVTGVGLNKYFLHLQPRSSYFFDYRYDRETLIARVQPINAEFKDVDWTSSNESVATVNTNGQVTGQLAGNAVITAKTADGQKTATCFVYVNSSSPGSSVMYVSLNQSQATIRNGETITLTATVNPPAANQAVTWTHVNGTGASVGYPLGNPNPLIVSATSPGVVTITATSVGDPTKTAQCTITITP